jgi:hypothetical protein
MCDKTHAAEIHTIQKQLLSSAEVEPNPLCKHANIYQTESSAFVANILGFSALWSGLKI